MFFKGKIYIENILKMAFIPMSFLHFFAVFYRKYCDLLQVVFQCKKYSESTVGNGTQPKTVIFTADIFAVWQKMKQQKIFICSFLPEQKNSLLHNQIDIYQIVI